MTQPIIEVRGRLTVVKMLFLYNQQVSVFYAVLHNSTPVGLPGLPSFCLSVGPLMHEREESVHLCTCDSHCKMSRNILFTSAYDNFNTVYVHRCIYIDNETNGNAILSFGKAAEYLRDHCRVLTRFV